MERSGRNLPVAITANANHATVTTLGGFSIRENAGTAAAATVNLRKGVEAANNTGDLLATIEFAGNESVNCAYPAGSAIAANGTYGVYVEVVSGSVTGVLYLRT